MAAREPLLAVAGPVLLLLDRVYSPIDAEFTERGRYVAGGVEVTDASKCVLADGAGGENNRSSSKVRQSLRRRGSAPIF